MLTFQSFAGINNVAPPVRLSKEELLRADNVDIGVTGEITRRDGYSLHTAGCHKNVWEGDGFVLASTLDDLIVLGGATIATAIGSNRLWFCNLPDGRTTFTNGLINGITDGTTTTEWGVPTPPSVGSAITGAGSLAAGEYRYGVTFVRADGIESGMAFSAPFTLTQGSGISFIGLPVDADYLTRVYMTTANGTEFYYAGAAGAGSLSFTGPNSSLVLPCRTAYLDRMPIGTVTAFWRGRVLVAAGNTLWGSLPMRWELCDMRRDFKQFAGNITLIQPMDNGIFIGTEDELVFMQGKEFDKLEYNPVHSGRVVLGSGVATDAGKIDPKRNGTAMVCIADGGILAGYGTGEIVRLTHTRYKTAATEVSACVRQQDGYLQYLAVPL